MTDVAVIGAGRIGGTLARRWASSGHQIIFGARDPGKPELRLLADGIDARVASIPDAVNRSGVVLFAIPGAAMGEAVAAIATVLPGKIVIDATNNMGGETVHSADLVAAVAPATPYFRAFNALGWELFDDPTVEGTQVDLFYCGPEGEPRAIVEQLIADVGLRPVRVGGPEAVDIVDGLLGLWLTLAVKQGRGRRLALKMIQEAR